MKTPPSPSPASWRDISRPHTTRALALAATGAVAGLLLAGFGLFTAEGTSTLAVPADAVALVNQQPISRVDFGAAVEALYATSVANTTAEQRRAVLEDLIREETLVQRGRELDVATVDPDVRLAMVKAVQESAAANAFTDDPDAAQLRAYYDARRDVYASEGTMSLVDLVFDEEQRAAAASAALKKGRTVEDVLKAFGGRNSERVKGEEFYFAAKIHLGDALFDVARTLPDGSVSEPTAEDGIHVLVMTKNAPPVPLPFEAARARVLTDYRRDAVERLVTANDKFLRARANILIAEDLRP
jgi:hypothetical protein